MSKQVEAQISDLNNQLDEISRNIQELNATKSRLMADNADIVRLLEEAESRIQALNRERSTLLSLLEEAKRNVDDEIRVRVIQILDMQLLPSNLEHFQMAIRYLRYWYLSDALL
ncbi:hypothetical protein DPMN_066823 [Dreissena polymorpha]|uniref:Uncharacterized protein n=1 Tax=Dreissena polymorpha TaxID=45954 RepID=A0A9D4BT62_DREPO|nr:hypothetical protein DPMN_066823 [Dreissena polymorpha]